MSARYRHPKSARHRMCNPAQSRADIGCRYRVPTYSRFFTFIHNKLFYFLQHIGLLSLTYNRTYIYFAIPFITSAKLNIHIHNIFHNLHIHTSMFKNHVCLTFFLANTHKNLNINLYMFPLKISQN